MTHMEKMDKMAAISQTTHSNAFPRMKTFCILIRISLKFVPNGPIHNKPPSHYLYQCLPSSLTQGGGVGVGVGVGGGGWGVGWGGGGGLSVACMKASEFDISMQYCRLVSHGFHKFIELLVNIALVNGLVSDGTKPLHKPRLTSHQQDHKGIS